MMVWKYTIAAGMPYMRVQDITLFQDSRLTAQLHPCYVYHFASMCVPLLPTRNTRLFPRSFCQPLLTAWSTSIDNCFDLFRAFG